MNWLKQVSNLNAFLFLFAVFFILYYFFLQVVVTIPLHSPNCHFYQNYLSSFDSHLFEISGVWFAG